MYLQEFSKDDIFKNILKVYPKFHFRIHAGNITLNNFPINQYSIYSLDLNK